jgi:hypothetical protein
MLKRAIDVSDAKSARERIIAIQVRLHGLTDGSAVVTVAQTLRAHMTPRTSPWRRSLTLRFGRSMTPFARNASASPGKIVCREQVFPARRDGGPQGAPSLLAGRYSSVQPRASARGFSL